MHPPRSFAFASGLPLQSLLPSSRISRRPFKTLSCAPSPPQSTPSPPPPKPKPVPKRRGNKLILCGLGNPGANFDNTRHNIGFAVADAFAARNGNARFKHESRLNASVATARLGGRTIYVVRPSTFMNNSGAALRAVMQYYGVAKGGVIVVADDMAIELGRVRLRAKGSAGGHNGLKSVEKYLGGQDYARLKVGVGEPKGGADRWSGYVLGKFSKGDAKIVDDVMWDTMDILDEWVKEEDLNRVMNTFTVRKSKAAK